MIYVYAVTESPPPPDPPPAQGLDGRPLEAVESAGVAAVFSRHAAGPVAPTPENLWRHEAVVEALMGERAVLPARFGTVFANEARAAELLSRHRDRLSAGLTRVRGCAEFGVRVLWQPPPPQQQQPEVPAAQASDGTGQGAGRAYMLARLAHERRRRAVGEQAERLATALHDALAPVARDATRRVLPADELLLAGAYLVPRERAGEFGARVRQLAAAHPDLRLLCTGPWPPYNFTPALGPEGPASGGSP